ncbi:MAG: hypothetical protein ABJC63_08155 [Gemmatimonadales bacterium]
MTARTSSLPTALREWTQRGIAPDRIGVSFDSIPIPHERDWLAALRSSGSELAWNGSLPGVGIEIQPVASPAGGYNVLVSAPNETQVVIGDEVGPIDTVSAGNGGARVTIPAASGVVTATSGGTTARTTLPDTLHIRRVLVIGDADWESKFVIAALEEDGWKVHAQMHVSPGVSVTQGSIDPVDTSRYAAVIALDASAAAHGAEIVRYVATGGGAIIAGLAASVESLSPLRAGAFGKIEPGSSLLTEPGTVTLQSLSLMPLAGLKNDAVVLERRGGAIAAAARRYGGGRVVQVGYLDTWRWRMSGADTSVAAHRKWWTHAVAGVAYAPVADLTVTPTTDDAPVARLLQSLGGPSPAPRASLASAAGSVSLWWLFAILSISLLAEWISRRTRGAR